MVDSGILLLLIKFTCSNSDKINPIEEERERERENDMRFYYLFGLVLNCALDEFLPMEFKVFSRNGNQISHANFIFVEKKNGVLKKYFYLKK